MLWTFAKRHMRKLRPLTRPYTTTVNGAIHYWTHDSHEITAHEFDVLVEQWNRRNK